MTKSPGMTIKSGFRLFVSWTIFSSFAIPLRESRHADRRARQHVGRQAGYEQLVCSRGERSWLEREGPYSKSEGRDHHDGSNQPEPPHERAASSTTASSACTTASRAPPSSVASASRVV